jgi:hypothetical protein
MEAIMVLEQSAKYAFTKEMPPDSARTEQDIALSCEETLVLYDFDKGAKANVPSGTRVISHQC